MPLFRIFGGGPRAEWRVIFIAGVMLAGLGVLASRLWWEQVARGDAWAKKIRRSSEVTVRIPSVRGEIRDRNGLTLVTNRASHEVDFYLPDMVRGYREKQKTDDTLPPLPRVEFELRVKQMLTKKNEPDIIHVVNTSIIPRLDELKLAKDYNSARLQRHYRNDTYVPYSYLEDLDFETVAKFSEFNVGLPGVEIAVKPVREYLYGALAAHMLGYVGAPEDIDKLADVKDYTFYQPDVEGKTQIETAYDKWLRGTPGVRVLHRDVKGVIEGEIRRDPPKLGNNVFLTIDARIQMIAERAIRAVGRGAAVVVDPNNGDILAMASVPSYDPNWFIPSISEENWAKIEADAADPLTNRAIQGYAPGSTFKLVTAIAGLRKGIPPSRGFNCSGSVTYGTKPMKCWIADKGGAHGTLGLADAIKQSCNCFFYQYGNAAGIDQIDTVGKELGLGIKTGVPLTGEKAGILPGPEWLKLASPQERWSDGYTANTSIGQGYDLSSPLQMAMVTATIANRGISYYPRLVSRIADADGKDVRDKDGNFVVPPEPRVRADLRQVGITEEQIEVVRDGMRRVVATGTAKKAQIKGVTVAGKTGTAQFWREERQGGQKVRIKDNHTWFVCFAPYDTPRYAVCVFVQGAKSGGGVSAPIAKKILEESFALEGGYDAKLAKLEPAKGSFMQIEGVDFESAAGVTKVVSQLGLEEDAADHLDMAAGANDGGSGIAKPTIREGADQRGKVGAGGSARSGDKKPNFFQRIFGFGSKKPDNKPKPQPFKR